MISVSVTVTDDDTIAVEGPEDLREHLLALAMGLASTVKQLGMNIDDVLPVVRNAYLELPPDDH